MAGVSHPFVVRKDGHIRGEVLLTARGRVVDEWDFQFGGRRRRIYPVEERFPSSRHPFRIVFGRCRHAPDVLFDKGERQKMSDVDRAYIQAVVALGPRVDRLVYGKTQERESEAEKPRFARVRFEVENRDPAKTRGAGRFRVDADDGGPDLRLRRAFLVGEVGGAAFRHRLRKPDDAGRHFNSHVLRVLAVAAGRRNLLRIAIPDPNQRVEIRVPACLSGGRSDFKLVYRRFCPSTSGRQCGHRGDRRNQRRDGKAKGAAALHANPSQ